MKGLVMLGTVATAFFCIGLPAPAAPESAAPNERDRIVQEQERSSTRVYVYVGQFSATRFNRIVRFDTDFQSSWIGVFGVSREFASIGQHLRVEGEVNFGQHWGMQNHQEVNFGFFLRWTLFPWDDLLDTSVAFGNGLSFAFQHPPIEEIPDQPAERFLTFMLAEIEVARPEWGDWSGFARIHHRSGVFGVVSDARGSNFVGLGVRRRY